MATNCPSTITGRKCQTKRKIGRPCLTRWVGVKDIALRCPKNPLFWPCKLVSKYKVTCHARNMLTKDGGSLLSFGFPGPQKVSDPYSKVENVIVRSSSYAHSKGLDEKNRPELFTILYYQYFEKYSWKTKWPLLLSLFPLIFQKVL